MLKRVGTFLATVVLAITASFALAAPAQADWFCPESLICFYYGTNGHGLQYNFNVTIGSNDWVDTYVGEPVRSNARSVKNNKVNAYISRIYWGASCGAIISYAQVVIHKTGGGNYGPPTVCFRTSWE